MNERDIFCFIILKFLKLRKGKLLFIEVALMAILQLSPWKFKLRLLRL